MSVKYEVLKKLVVAAGLEKRWLSVADEGFLEVYGAVDGR